MSKHTLEGLEKIVDLYLGRKESTLRPQMTIDTAMTVALIAVTKLDGIETQLRRIQIELENM